MVANIYKDTQDEIWRKTYDASYEIFCETGSTCNDAAYRATFVADTAINPEKPDNEITN